MVRLKDRISGLSGYGIAALLNDSEFENNFEIIIIADNFDAKISRTFPDVLQINALLTYRLVNLSPC